jgi:hypothetical protein
MISIPTTEGLYPVTKFGTYIQFSGQFGTITACIHKVF